MKHTKKLLSLLLVLCLILSLSCTAFAADEAKPLTGKTVILHSNDVHGAIDLYAAMASLKADYEAQGAEVILADAGDYSQGTVYVSVHKGADAVTMMNATGYDVATIGNHEFDYGYAQLAENMKAAKFKVLCADGKTIFDANTIIEKGGVKIGFFGLETPEAQTKANPKLIEGLKFLAGKDGKELYACADAQVKALKEQGCNAAYLYIVAADSQQQPCRRAHGAEGQQTPPAAAIQPVEPGHLFLRRQVHGNDLCRLGRPQLPQGLLLQHQHRLAADGVPEGIPGVVQGPQPQPPAL